jgi:hypothetical protein
MKMKKLAKYLFSGLCAFLFASCDVELSSHGNLYGYWHLESIDSIGSGTHVDMKDQLKFWAVQSRLIELSDHDWVYSPVIFHFDQVGDSLFLYDAHFNNRETGDPELEGVWQVQVYGINSLSPRLRIDALTSGELTLSTREVRMKLKKF